MLGQSYNISRDNEYDFLVNYTKILSPIQCSVWTQYLQQVLNR